MIKRIILIIALMVSGTVFASFAELEPELSRFTRGDTVIGNQSVGELMAFLDSAERAEPVTGSGYLPESRWWLSLLMVLFGGLMLNLTPCVLPMIPVNLAIIGAGSGARSKWLGFWRGGIYGAGIAAAYGLFGVFTVMTGAKFGSLNSQPWFNFIIAAVFVVLTMAMLDVFSIDLSRYGGRMDTKLIKKGHLLAVFVLGAIAALLAGACVAPVVIAVLMYAASHYAGGEYWALLLPFALGIGMASPWPFAGAGLEMLPKPGKWMKYVKWSFAAIMILMAVYYGRLGWKLLPDGNIGGDGNLAALEAAVMASKKSGKPLVIDFWASWCKSCVALKNGALADPSVDRRLREDFIFIPFQAEKPDNPETRAVLDYFKVMGLPTLVMLRPPRDK